MYVDINSSFIICMTSLKISLQISSIHSSAKRKRIGFVSYIALVTFHVIIRIQQLFALPRQKLLKIQLICVCCNEKCCNFSACRHWGARARARPRAGLVLGACEAITSTCECRKGREGEGEGGRHTSISSRKFA